MDRKRDIFYKQRTRKGPGDRQERARQKDVESKSKRANLLASKRRIPLSEIQEEEKGKFGTEKKNFQVLKLLLFIVHLA